MGVYIKDMEIPKSCGDCPIGDSLCCPLMPGVPALWKEYTIAVIANRRHSDCPLVRVPPHGDLIDRDKLREKEFIHDGDAYAVVMSRDIRNAATIIPAEEDET